VESLSPPPDVAPALSDARDADASRAIRRLGSDRRMPRACTPVGYLLEHFGHARQASALHPFAKAAKSLKPLDPSVKRLAALAKGADKPREAPAWKLSLNVPLEIDA
jgi:hypothetical protein